MIEEKNNSWIFAVVLALVIHVTAFAIVFSHKASEPVDGAVGAGQQGVQVDLGMMGDLGAHKQKKTAPKAEVKPKEQAKPIEKPKPVEPTPAPEPQKVEPIKPKQLTAVLIKKPTPKPKKKKIKPKKKSKPKPKQKIVKPEKTVEKTTNKQAVASSDANGHDAVNQRKTSTGVGNAATAGAQSVTAKRSYEGVLLALLLKQKRYPNASVRRGEEGVVTLSFKLDRTGKVISYSIAKSSGHRRLDKEVITMIQRVKFPPFLAGMTQDSLSVNVPISFKLISE